MRVRLLHPEDDFDLSPRLPNTLIYLTEDDLELRAAIKGHGQRRLISPRSRQESGSAQGGRSRHHRVSPAGAGRLPGESRCGASGCTRSRSRATKCGARCSSSGIVFREPGQILADHCGLLEPLVDNLKQLRRLCDEHAGRFHSAGFRQLIGDGRRSAQRRLPAAARRSPRRAESPAGHAAFGSARAGNKGATTHCMYPRGEAGGTNSPETTPAMGLKSIHVTRPAREALVELAGKAINDIANTVPNPPTMCEDSSGGCAPSWRSIWDA